MNYPTWRNLAQCATARAQNSGHRVKPLIAIPPEIVRLDRIFEATGDPGSFIKQELEQGLEPVTKRVSQLEKKLDLLLLALDRIEALLKTLQPLAKLIQKVPFLK